MNFSWRNYKSTGPEWKVHTGDVDAKLWSKVTGSSTVPGYGGNKIPFHTSFSISVILVKKFLHLLCHFSDNKFLMTHDKSGEAILATDVIGCQDGPGVLSFK